ncbi:ndor1 [Symbiodinium pilosum]|uniref:Ndor1 protein n=1 Tax=Symbiodinium pilosum TaxID=2952 RepID=A0A812UAQ2_SYMPI|nr:ndor1 [Symbiodinium pilosum]
MKLASSLQKTSALEKHFHTKHPLRLFYRDVLDEVEGCKGYFDLSAVWSRLAPSGNIYRLNALHEVRLRHCADLQAQLRDMAEEYAETLGGTQEERYSMLVAALKEAKVDLDEAYESAEKGWELDSFKTTGFPPLEEFVVGNVKNLAGLCVVPTDPGAWKDWCTAKLVGCMVAVVQILGPVMVVLSLWEDPTNYLQHPLETFERLSVSSIFCTDRSRGEWCTILMGVVFSFFVVVQLLNYAAQELEDAYKFGRLAGCASFWAFAGGYINAWCVMWNILVLPVCFWKLTHASQVVLNAMTILFMFNLDDLTGTAGAVLGTSDALFQRGLCWNYALLSQCPIDLRDVVNPKATSAEDFWQLRLTATALQSTRASESAGASRNAETRISPFEQTPLLATQKGHGIPSLEQMKVCMRFSKDGITYQLPSAHSTVQANVWQLIVWLLRLLQVLMPVFYFIVNKPCIHATDVRKH